MFSPFRGGLGVLRIYSMMALNGKSLRSSTDLDVMCVYGYHLKWICNNVVIWSFVKQLENLPPMYFSNIESFFCPSLVFPLDQLAGSCTVFWSPMNYNSQGGLEHFKSFAIFFKKTHVKIEDVFYIPYVTQTSVVMLFFHNCVICVYECRAMWTSRIQTHKHHFRSW